METTRTTEIDSEDLLFSLLNVNVLECDEGDSHEVEFLPFIFRMYEEKRKEPNSSSSKNEVITDKENKKSVEEPTDSIQTKSKGGDDNETIEEYPKRIRRSKYDYISGDLSHIRRDPKCVLKRKGAVTETPGSSKKICCIPDYGPQMELSQMKDQKLQVNNDALKCETILTTSYEDTYQAHKENKSIKSVEVIPTKEKEDDVLVVRELMKYLYCPKSKEHQNVALALLSADQNLMRIFMKEKKNAMQQLPPVSGNSEL